MTMTLADLSDCRNLLDAWLKACWASGVHPRCDSDNPLEVLAYRTGEMVKRLSGETAAASDWHDGYARGFAAGSAEHDADYERLRGMEERVKGAAVGEWRGCEQSWKAGGSVEVKFRVLDINYHAPMRVALVPVPGGE